uniref:Neutrophil antibiotic peptide NP-1 n=1 Tax=Rattus norvegicus TaxID=10116 RepID=DEF1_RAT|nr:RecName: Full=Neutrophil antibiotic peptide NP-1; Short=RatNP-1; AltName: Full=Neutrophil defensin 1; Flags: Precursor [Rattus norvegicus]AAA91974.1 defensin RatNP-1 precursor [Rattus norvegicus]
MRTLTLLTALLLLALHTQAKSPQGTAEEAPDQEQLVMEDQDISISFGGDKGTALQDADVKAGVTCYCRRTRCGFRERLSGACGYRGRIYRLCCR